MMWGSDTQEEALQASKAIAYPSIEIPSEVVHGIFLAGCEYKETQIKREVIEKFVDLLRSYSRPYTSGGVQGQLMRSYVDWLDIQEALDKALKKQPDDK